MSRLTLVTDDSKSIIFVCADSRSLLQATQDIAEWVEELVDTKDSYSLVNRKDFRFSALKFAYKTGAIIIALGNDADKTLTGIPHFKLPHPSAALSGNTIAARLSACKSYIHKESK